MKDLVGAVLAGGASARMGRDKATLPVPGDGGAGETLGERAVRVLRACCADVVALGHARGIPDDVERIPDAALPAGAPAGEAGACAGPVAGVLALLESGRGARYAVVAVDMPGIGPGHLARLVRALDEDDAGARAACFVLAGRLEPLPVVIDAAAGDAVARLARAGERRLGAVLEALAPARVPVADRGAFRNLNTVADLSSLR